MIVAVLGAAVLAWPGSPAQAREAAPPDQPTEQRSDGHACATGADRPYVLTTTPVLAARQSDPDAGQQDLTTTFVWRRGSTVVGQGAQSAGNPSFVAVGVPAGRLADGETYTWQAQTFDGDQYGPWSTPCEFTVDVTSPEAPAGVTSTDYPADGPHGGVGVPGQFLISPPQLRPEEVVAYAWSVESGAGPAGAPTVPADAGTHGATLRFAPSHDGPQTLRVWSKDRAGRFSAPATWTFTVTAEPADPGPARPSPPSISFPDGDTTVQGGTLSVRFDANGDESVTEFRYSVRFPALDLTAVPDEPGGFAVVEIPAGSSAGEVNVYAVARIGTTASTTTAGTFRVRSLTSLTGRVVDVGTFLPVAGAVVRLEPGGHQVTTGADGEFSFSTAAVPPGTYTLTASDGACSTELPIEIDGQGSSVELYLGWEGCES